MRKPIQNHPRHDLGALSEAWRGWTLIGPDLVSPEGWTIPASWVRALPLTREALGAHRNSADRARRERIEARQLHLAARTIVEALAGLETAASDLKACLAGTARPNRVRPAAGA